MTIGAKHVVLYLEHPDGDNGQREEEGVEQKGEAAKLSSALAFWNIQNVPVQLVEEHFLLVIFNVRGEKGRCGHRLHLTLHPNNLSEMFSWLLICC